MPIVQTVGEEKEPRKMAYGGVPILRRFNMGSCLRERLFNKNKSSRPSHPSLSLIPFIITILAADYLAP